VPLSFIDVPECMYVDGLTGIYELNQVELLRDVYVWAYERSARQCKTVRDSLPEPDPFCLKYRTASMAVVGEAVRQRLPTTAESIDALARTLVASKDREQFTQLALAELRGLHEGNIARFRVRPSGFRGWPAK
jgi:hypothetical protein